MISVKTNRNIMDFKANIAGGFDLKETISIVVGLVIGVGIMCVLMFTTNIPTIILPYICMPFIALPIAKGFFKKNGMGLSEYKKKTAEYRKCCPAEYISTETPEAFSKYFLEDGTVKKDDDGFDKLMEKIKFYSVILLGVIILAIVAIVLYMFVL